MAVFLFSLRDHFPAFMKILLLGATGRTGKLLLEQALKAGIAVHALVRDTDKVKVIDRNLKLYESKTLDRTALRLAMQGCDAVLSTLSISRKSEFPWSGLKSPKDFLSHTLRNVLEIANELHIKRIIITTAWGVHETKKDIPGWFRFFIDYSNVGAAYRDHEIQENLLRASPIDWTIVRPVGLINSRKNRKIRLTLDNQPKPSLTISRTNVAKFMVEIYKTGDYKQEAVTISEV
ncbi:NAD-dependent epimerase/dehydratase family protein [Larkinella rosea]|uniref:NAD-dependent epimerase/dehydratase family protein n=2 Tax=Larkinella rosea TaxID=2025312 RepID=A0A3P1BCW1_9BACT|nr:NAD-dependent epimerase/dehydratase family protein [Larkinella rosea]